MVWNLPKCRWTARLVIAAIGLLGSASTAPAWVWVEWRPTANPVCVNQEFEIGLFFKSTGGVNDNFIAADITFNWDHTKLQFLGINNSSSIGGGGSIRQSVVLFPDNTCGLNEAFPPADGTGFYNLLGPTTGVLVATPAGVRITRFRFKAIAPGTAAMGTQFLLGFCYTKVYGDEAPNYPIIEPVIPAYGATSVQITTGGPLQFTSAPVNTAVECDGAGNQSALNAWLNSATASAPCGSTVNITNNFAGLSDLCGGTGATTVTWTATDSSNNSITTSATFTIQDTTAPSLTVPSDITAQADSPDGVTKTFASLPSATAGDACGGATVSMSRSDGMPNLLDPYSADDSPVVITWMAQDACGRTATGTQEITIIPVVGKNLVVDVELSPSMDDPSPALGDTVERCITFELWNCDTDTAPSATIDQVIAFPVDTGLPHRVNGVVVQIPDGTYSCVTARDKLHSLRSKAPSFLDQGSYYAASFVDGRSVGGHWLLQGNLNQDRWIDVVDFGIYANRFQSLYATGDTACSTPLYHADITGDGKVFTEDFTFIQINVLKSAEPNCCGMPGADDLEDDGPLMDVAVSELWERGLGELATADLNQDGRLNQQDIDLFMSWHGIEPVIDPDAVRPADRRPPTSPSRFRLR